jgi:hypothetical protein
VKTNKRPTREKKDDACMYGVIVKENKIHNHRYLQHNGLRTQLNRGLLSNQ